MVEGEYASAGGRADVIPSPSGRPAGSGRSADSAEAIACWTYRSSKRSKCAPRQEALGRANTPSTPSIAREESDGLLCS